MPRAHELAERDARRRTEHSPDEASRGSDTLGDVFMDDCVRIVWTLGASITIGESTPDAPGHGKILVLRYTISSSEKHGLKILKYTILRVHNEKHP